MCGHTHLSEKALQEAIDSKIKDIPFDFQKQVKELQNLSDKLAREVNAELETYTKEIKQVDDALVKAKSEREELTIFNC